MMLRSRIAELVVACGQFAAAGALASAAAPQESVAWQSDLDGARAAAAASGRPMLIVFRCER